MNHRTIRYLGAILAVAVVLRVVVAIYLGDIVDAPPLLTDQRSYAALGERLISGHGFSFDRGWYPFTDANTPTAHWSFLYSVFVAAVYAILGVHPLAARLVQAILGGIALPLMVYLFTGRVFGASRSQVFSKKMNERGFNTDHIALLAAGVTAIYFYFVLYAATIMTETFYMAALLWALERSIALAEQPTWKRATLLGIGLGIATLLRQSVLPWVAVLIVWLLWVGWRSGYLRRMIAGTSLALALMFAAVAPFTLRNYLVYGQFLLLNSNAGYAMYSAQHPMQGTHFQEFAAAPVPDDLQGLNEAQKDRILMQRGIGFVLADPGRYLLLSLSRVPAYFEFWPTSDTTLINNIGRIGSWGLFLPFIVYGLWLALRAASPRAAGGWLGFSITPLAMVVLFTTFYSLLHILTWAMPRYRLPIDAVLMLFAALAIYDLTRRVMVRMTVGQSPRAAVHPQTLDLELGRKNDMIPKHRIELE